MKKYFGKVSDEYFQTGGNTDGLFIFNGAYYFYCLVYSSDGITLQDTIGRSVPLCYEESLALFEALASNIHIISKVVAGEEALEYLCG